MPATVTAFPPQSYFNGSVFLIPNNQRGYSWERQNIDELISDLKFARKTERQHYLGTCTLIDRGIWGQDDGADNIVKREVQDGQQRITTLMLLARAISNHSEFPNLSSKLQGNVESFYFHTDENGNRVWKIQNEKREYNRFLGDLLENPKNCPDPTSPTTRRLLAASTACEDAIGSMALNDLRDLAMALVGHSQMIFFSVEEDEIDVHLLFDATNTRGLHLTEFDKVKNYAMLVADRWECASVNPDSKWHDALMELESGGFQKREDEDKFLRDCHASFFGRKISAGLSHPDFVEEFNFQEQPSSSRTQKEQVLRDIVESWPTFARAYKTLANETQRNSAGVPAKASKAIERLVRMDRADYFKNLLVCAWIRRSANDYTDNEFVAIAEACEKFAFRVTCTPDSRRVSWQEAFRLKLANDCWRGGKTATEIVDDLAEHAKAECSLETMIDRIADGKARYPFASEFKGWDACYYFLFEYETGQHSQASTYQWNKYADSVEHICPQSFREDPQGPWANALDASSQPDRFVHRIGNLTLTSQNSSLGTKPYDQKIQLFQHGSNQSHPTVSERIIARDFPQGPWDCKSILKRERMMMAWAARRWAFPAELHNARLPQDLETKINSDPGLVRD